MSSENMYEIDKEKLWEYSEVDIYYRGENRQFGLFIPKNSNQDLKTLKPQHKLYVNYDDRIALVKRWIKKDVNNILLSYEDDPIKAKSYLIKVAEYFFEDIHCSVIEESKYFIGTMASIFEKNSDIMETLSFLTSSDFSLHYHNINVMLYCMDFASKNTGKRDDVILAGLTGFLHDIGKVDIDEDILMKKEPLTKNEFDIIKDHPRNGIRILKDCKIDSRIIDSVWEHHERLDGSGYPRGKYAESLGLHSRLLAIIDSFDALTSERPYRKKVSVMEAFKKLKEDSDKGKYDFMILKQFAKCFIGTDL